MTPFCRSSEPDTNVCAEIGGVASSFNALLISSLADGQEMRLTRRRSVADTLSVSMLSLPVRYRRRITRPRSVAASSGSSNNNDSIMKPGMLAAIAGETEMGRGGGRLDADEASDRSLSLSLSLLLPFFFEETSGRSTSGSTLWNKSSLRKAARYFSGALERRSPSSCKAPITRVGWSLDDRIDDANSKLAIGTD